MTATIREPGRDSRRNRVRFASMELFGFIDRPGVATNTWTSLTAPPRKEAVPVTVRGRHEAPLSPPKPDPFDDWQPTEVGKALLRHNVRWSLLTGILLIAAGAAVFGYWLYQRPVAAAAEASEQLTATAAPIDTHLEELRGLSVSLTEQPPVEGANATLLAAESAARALFEATSDLPSSEATRRSAAADAASDTLEASRLLSDAYAYREAVIPILALPVFEDDPNLIGLDDAARQFGEWQMKFDNVRSVLPVGTLTSMSAELELISGELETTQSRYLDALRDDDQKAASAVLEGLVGRLETAEALLFEELAVIQARVEERIDAAAARLPSLLG